jgi:hypothetical protein
MVGKQKPERSDVRSGSFTSVSRCPRHFRLSPNSGGIADIAGSLKRANNGLMQAQQTASLFDHFVGAGDERWRNHEPKCLGSLEVDHQLELGWLHHRQIFGLSALQNPSVILDLAVSAAPIGPLSASPALPAQGSVGSPSGRHMANTWQGEFPQTNLASDSYERSSPVDAFPPNGFGLLDMIGNVSIAVS